MFAFIYGSQTYVCVYTRRCTSSEPPLITPHARVCTQICTGTRHKRAHWCTDHLSPHSPPFQAVPALTTPASGARRDLLLDSGFLLHVVGYVCTAVGLDSVGATYQGPCTREAAAGHLRALAKAMVGLCEGRPASEVHRVACVLPVLAPLLTHAVGRGVISVCDAGWVGSGRWENRQFTHRKGTLVLH